MKTATSVRLPSGGAMTAIGLMCAAIAIFAMVDTIAKFLTADYSTVQIVWARYAGHMLFTLMIFRPRTIMAQFRSQRLRLQIFRGTALFVATLSNFVALRYLQLAETVSIFFLAPLVVAVLAIIFLDEKVGPHRWGAIIVGFVGVLVVVRPGFGGLHWAVVFSFIAVAGYGFYSIITRMLAGVDRPETSLLFSALAGVAIASPFVPFFWIWPSDLMVWGLFFLMGLCAAVGHYLLILAHNSAGASVLAPFIYTSIIWMVLSGYLVFGDVPGWSTLVGASIVIGSGLYLLYRERSQPGSGADEK